MQMVKEILSEVRLGRFSIVKWFSANGQVGFVVVRCCVIVEARYKG